MFPHRFLLLLSPAPPSFPISTNSHRAKLAAAQNPRGLDHRQRFPGHGRSWTTMIPPDPKWPLGSRARGGEARGRAITAITRLSAISRPPFDSLLLLSISSVRLSFISLLFYPVFSCLCPRPFLFSIISSLPFSSLFFIPLLSSPPPSYSLPASYFLLSSIPSLPALVFYSSP